MFVRQINIHGFMNIRKYVSSGVYTSQVRTADV
jgi:hypothetical protein